MAEAWFPPGCYTLPLANCAQTSKLKKITTSEEYSRALQVDTEGSGQYEVGAEGSKGVMSAEVSQKHSFKVSAGCSGFKTNVGERMAERFELKSHCIHYEVGYGDDYVRVPTASFLVACKKMVYTMDIEDFNLRKDEKENISTSLAMSQTIEKKASTGLSSASASVLGALPGGIAVLV